MSVFTIPWQSGPAFEQLMTLEQSNYVFRFKWNTLFSYWALDILDQNKVLLTAGLKIVLNVELLRRARNPALPSGYLIAVPQDDSIVEISRKSMGDNVQLYYVDSDEELAALGV